MNPHNTLARKVEQRRKQPSPALERKWRRIISQWRASGLDGRAFIRAHNLPEASFYGWKRTLRLRDMERARQAKRRAAPKPRKRVNATKKVAAVPAFVPVSVTPPPVTAAIELVLVGGHTLRVPAGFDEATLTRLVSALERP